MAEFERVCLDPGKVGDQYLAEVASCHQILTLVLGEPVEVDADLKRRLYGLASVQATPPNAAPPAAAPPAVAPPVEPVAAPAAIAPSEPEPVELPDYLRAARKSRRKYWYLLATAAVLGVVGWFGAAALEKPAPPPDLPDTVAQNEDGELIVPDLEMGQTVPDEPAEATPADPTSEAPAFDAGTTEGVDTSALTPETDSTMPGESEQPTEFSVADPDGVFDTPGDDPDTVVSVGPGDTEVEILEPLEPSAPVESGAEQEPSEGIASPDALLAGPDETVPDTDTPVAPEPSGPAPIGMYLAGSYDVLLIQEPVSGDWFRLADQSAITTGDRLLTLPSDRVTINLEGFSLRLLGGTEIRLPVVAERPEGVPSGVTLVELAYGRVMFNSLQGTRLVVSVGGNLREIELGSGSILAVEAFRQFEPGSDFESDPSPLVAEWHMIQGTATILGDVAGLEAPGKREVSAGDSWSMLDGEDGQIVPNSEAPDWVQNDRASPSEGRARAMLAEALLPGSPVGLRLLEINSPSGPGRRSENRALIAEASVYVGEYEPFVKELNDKQAATVWESHIRTLREALARSPEATEMLRKAFVTQRGEAAADDLMKLIRGFTPEEIGMTREEINEGALFQLISWLNHDFLDYRVLAFYNLSEITQTKNLEGYSPKQSLEARERVQRKLWARLESGDLRPRAF